MSEPLLWSLFWRFMQPLRTISNLMDVVETPESQSPAWEDPIGALLGYQAGMEAHTC